MNRPLVECCQKSIRIALIVGSILTLVNQGQSILNLTIRPQDFVRIFFNFLIPLFVSTYSRLALLKEMEGLKKDQPLEVDPKR